MTSAAASAVSANSLAVAPSSDTWEKALLTLLGTFVGAMLAFLAQIALRKKDERKAELLAAHRILFCLFQQLNTLVLFQREWVAPHKKSPVQFIEIPAASEFDLSKNLFDFTSFGFLLKSSGGRQIMYDLYLAQESYIETLRAINERSRMHRELLQPKLAGIGIGAGKPVSLQDLVEVLGPLVHGSMVNVTEQMLSSLQHAFGKLMIAKAAFRPFAVTYFKSSDFTEFDFPELYGLAEGQE
ncbi:MAG: hypothetical protein V4772_14970 [Pseudomonadota bacterium]